MLLLALLAICGVDTVRQYEVESGSVRLSVQAAGSGDVLVELHGGPGYSRGYLPLAELAVAKQETCAPAVREVVRFDQRGCGRSRTPSDAPLTLDANVEDIESLRKQAKAERITVLGHSWGGFLAEAYAVAHPDRVSKLILVDPMPARFEDLRLIFEPPNPPPPEGDDCRPALRAELPKPIPDATCSVRTMQKTFASLGKFDLRPQLAKLEIPTLLIYGESDPNLATAKLQQGYFAKAKPRLEVIGGAGHYPFLDQPAKFHALVRDFLR
jgi:proline iminopeptidase